ncbi:MAG: hypothetical protein LC667_04070 [Thioalkalivibrio sp.]|nr:hypothetical protein [Thioalkalivibrio sp.]
MPLDETLRITLSDIDLGASDAEADRKLSEYFVTTPYVSSAIQVRATHFIGRKGAGKSALFRELARLIREAGYEKVETIQITPDQYAWTALKDYREQGLTPEQAHSNAWKFTIAIELAAAIARRGESGMRSEEAHNAVRALRHFIESNFGGLQTSLTKSATKLLKGIRSFNLEAFGFGVGIERDRVDQPLTPMVIDELLGLSKCVAEESGYVITLDRLDDSWDGTPEARHLLIGLLKAAKEINDRYSTRSPEGGLSVLVFLRADIYEGLAFDDKDKHRALEEHVVWDPQSLEDMINARLPKGVEVADLFEPGEMRGSIPPFNYVVKRTFLRPREVIQFLQECIRRADKDSLQITKDQVREAEQRYSSWKVDDLKQEYRRVNPEFDSALEALRQGYHRYDSRDDFEELIRVKLPRIATDDSEIRRIVEMLFNASVIGVRLGNSGSPRFRCEDSDLVLPNVGAIYVHQSLFKGLSIRERRSTGDEQEDD